MIRKTAIYFMISFLFTLTIPLFIAVLAFFQEMEFGPVEMFFRVATAPFFLTIALIFTLARTAYAFFMKFSKEGDDSGTEDAHNIAVHGDDGGMGLG